MPFTCLPIPTAVIRQRGSRPNDKGGVVLYRPSAVGGDYTLLGNPDMYVGDQLCDITWSLS